MQHVQPGAVNGTAVQRIMPLKVSRSVRCTSCDITLNSQQQAKQHYSGKAHQRRLHKLHQQRLKELRLSDSAEEKPTTESRIKEPPQDAADTKTRSSGADDVMSERVDVDVVSTTAMPGCSECNATNYK